MQNLNTAWQPLKKEFALFIKRLPWLYRQNKGMAFVTLPNGKSFDIVFLDIIMRGLDGMRTAQIFREKAFDKMLIIVSKERQKKKLFLDDIYYFEIKGRMINAHEAYGRQINSVKNI